MAKTSNVRPASYSANTFTPFVCVGMQHLEMQIDFQPGMTFARRSKAQRVTGVDLTLSNNGSSGCMVQLRNSPKQFGKQLLGIWKTNLCLASAQRSQARKRLLSSVNCANPSPPASESSPRWTHCYKGYRVQKRALWLASNRRDRSLLPCHCGVVDQLVTLEYWSTRDECINYWWQALGMQTPV
jgi:hypothetical protein